MHYFKRNLGDIAKKTAHLSPLEFGIYNLIMDGYYAREQAPTLLEATRWARARTAEEKEAVLGILDEFFTVDGERYLQSRVEEEIAAYHGKAETNRAIAVAREAQKRARKEHDSCTTGEKVVHDSGVSGEPNQEPRTINQEPDKPLGADAPEREPEFALTAPGDTKRVQAKPEYPDAFELAWQAYPARHGGNPKKDAFRCWSARCKEGVKVEVLQGGVERYAAHLKAAGKLGTEYVMQAVRFFGTSKPYAEPWPVGLAPVTSKPNGRPSSNNFGQDGDDADDPFNELRRA